LRRDDATWYKMRPQPSMEIHFDGDVPLVAASRVHHVVHQTLSGRARPGVHVWVSRPRPGRWSVFISGLSEHTLAISQAIENALGTGDEVRGPDKSGH
jgi:hypothetical protein